MPNQTSPRQAEPDLRYADGLPFPTDLELVMAIHRRMQIGEIRAAVGLVKQYRERLLYHSDSQAMARSLGAANDPT